MDAERFDLLARGLFTAISRRRTLGALLAGPLAPHAGAAAAATPGQAPAAEGAPLLSPHELHSRSGPQQRRLQLRRFGRLRRGELRWLQLPRRQPHRRATSSGRLARRRPEQGLPGGSQPAGGRPRGRQPGRGHLLPHPDAGRVNQRQRLQPGDALLPHSLPGQDLPLNLRTSVGRIVLRHRLPDSGRLRAPGLHADTRVTDPYQLPAALPER